MAIEEEEHVELPEALAAARDQLVSKRDELTDQAAPLREQLAELDSTLARVQQAIDALEGREPDAAASLRAPGALADRLSPAVRAGFRTDTHVTPRGQITRADSRRLREVVYEVLPVGEENAVGRTELTQFAAVKVDFHINKNQVSRAVNYLIEDERAKRSYPENPKDTRYWKPPAESSDD
jgi:septal ring factor EnvC (AmiA/AmiB activator)